MIKFANISTIAVKLPYCCSQLGSKKLKYMKNTSNCAFARME